MTEQENGLLTLLQKRFEENEHRHPGIRWVEIQRRLEADPEKLEVLSGMERTGGEPDVIGYDSAEDAYIVCDCSPESPAGRRSICYDGAALAARKKNKPETSAAELAAELGIEILDEAEYRALQEIEPLDRKTSSWILTPEAIRKKGGALFCDRRYDHVFTYHNGADSYYGARGFRGRVLI
ncbi:DUF4256 domain-containing protein [Sporosarcina trichiuri]|uniref:DUF4256 domain-containing protein n=1 Tax=Sporosarcina trichiuri TaxID=3056445 RepID=UPI0025B617F0|nr:DUF4256 domain-containing protein [Sporosarcina sp. 0.2-SM1T-5]WJY27510.1 DUF4256 domain-containing protein [Sporosarcina sp. 0.2-SM1T-5]